jgi:protein-L-isoaspartate(D-aspartate) O-methyltransferase
VPPSSRDSYRFFPDGTQVPQTTNPELIAAMLELLEVPVGARVLEIGTGSGYSTALLCDLVGPEGRVVSLDVDEGIVVRAAALLAQEGLENAEVRRADGRAGYRSGAPFDRIVAWGSVPELPRPWIEQLDDGGMLLAPLSDGTVVRVRKTAPEIVERVAEAGFVPLGAEPLTPWLDRP